MCAKESRRKPHYTMGSKRMTAPVTNQIISKHSLEILAKISKWKYFGHIMHCWGSIKRSDVRTDKWQWKIRKTVYKMISRNLRNHDN